MTFGILIGGFMVFYLQDRLRDSSYGYSILILMAVVIVLMLVTAVPYYMIMASQLSGQAFTSPETLALIKKQLFEQIDPVYVLALPMVAGSQLMIQVSNKFGPGVLWKIVLGTYNKAKVENRIFMFADLNDSTTIAEQLSDVRFHDLLKNFFADITNPILNSGGEIYQYLGDGIIIVWKHSGNETDLRSVECFFEMKAAVEAERSKYEKKFGMMPQFKAGIHCGKAVVGEIGVIKRDISYTGDVVNTASRIQGMCKELKSELLVSDELLRSAPPESKFETTTVGSIQLKGKTKEIPLSKVMMRQGF